MKRKSKVLQILMSVLTSAAVAAAGALQAAAAVDNSHVCAVESNAWTNWPQAADIQCGTGILIDAETGTILFNKGMDDQRYPASTTKIMTCLVALENSTPDMQVTFTETGMADAYSGSSNIIPKLGETFTMEQCIYMIMLKSANDVSTQVAETIGGSVENFINMMNQKAVDLGCTNTHFNNASGLPDENHYTSAHDLARIAQAALQNETFCQVVATQSYTVPATNLSGARVYENHHKMLLDNSDVHYDGCLGGKTGYTDSSLSTLVTFAERDGFKVISVVMYGLGDAVVYNDTRQLLDYAFTNFKKNEAGMLTTADGKILYQNQALTEQEYQQAIATPTPTPTQEPEPTEVVNSSSDSEPAPSAEQTADKMPMYVAIGVLSALILVGIILIIAGCIRNHRRNKA